MTDDIFDYFSGNSNRKVEPIDDDDDQVESPLDPVQSNVGEENALPVADEVDEKISHWDRLLGKLGITPAAKKTAPAQAVQLPVVSAEKKAARALKRKEPKIVRGQDAQPFGGIAAPPGSKPIVQPPDASPVGQTPRAESVSRSSKQPKKSHFTKKEQPPVAQHKFGKGILDEISTGVPEHGTPHGTETLADLFAASEQFEPPFEEVRREVNDLDAYPIDDPEPLAARLDEAPERTSDLADDYVADVAEFIEYDVQDLDFSESTAERPRRPSRRDRARRGRTKTEFEDQSTPPAGRGRREQAEENTPKPPAPSRRGRNTREPDEEDLDFERDESATVKAESPPARSRRRSRGRGRGRGSQDARPPHDAVDREEVDDVEFDESLDSVKHEEVDDHEEGRDRGRGRKSRGTPRRSPQQNRVRDVADIDDTADSDGDPYGVYDDVEPETARDSGRRRQPEDEDEDMELDVGKRPQIPTWSEAVASMVELNIKTRGSKPAGAGRGRGPRRPRRR